MLSPNLNKLKDCLKEIPQAGYSHESRVHTLKTFPLDGCRCYIKREDELGGIFCGSKLRKYRSLIPYLLDEGFSEVVVIGGAYSNNVLGVTQLLIENGIKPTLFLRGDPCSKPKGNYLFISLLLTPESIRWIPRNRWNEVHSLAEEYIKHSSHKAFVLAEGASTMSAFPGTLTLALDILRNEEDLNLSFDHIFVEAGTGMMASSLILALSWLQKPTTVHVLMMAEGSEAFDKTLKGLSVEFEKLVKASVSFPTRCQCYQPKTAKSFGSTNKSTFDEIRQLAKMEGFFCDPIYTAKLFAEARGIITEQKLLGNILVIHSGGTFALSGFQDYL